MDLGLDGKTVIVTGGGSNIGRAISLAFVKEGSNVVMAELDQLQGQKVASEAATIGPGRCTVVKTDVTKLNEVEAMVKRAIAEFGQIDVLVNNVGWDIPQLFVDTEPEFWDRVVSTNYRSVLNCVKAVLPHMVARHSGCIVSLGSDAGRVGEFRESVYSGTKGAIIAFSKAVAREVGPSGIRLNVVCPGVTVPAPEQAGEASMWKGEVGKLFTPEIQEKVARGYPLRRLGKAEDVSKAVVFLASDAASYITGQTLSVSGGYTMI